jgi:protein-disulfide isomerase-like protein with CxxC motif
MISDHNTNSYRGNIAGYCAAREGAERFWPLYDAIQTYMNETYYSKGIGDKKGAPEIPKFDNQVYIDLADQAGLDQAKFTSCLDNQETEKELDSNTEKARNLVTSGVPYFVFNSYRSSGFEGNYNTIKQMFRAGGVQ